MVHTAGVVEEVAAHAIEFPDEGKFEHVPIDRPGKEKARKQNREKPV